MGSAGGLVGSSEVGGEGTYGDLAGAAFFASGRYAAAFRDRLPRFFLVSGLVWRWCDGGWQEVFVAALHLWLCHQGASLVSDDSDPRWARATAGAGAGDGLVSRPLVRLWLSRLALRSHDDGMPVDPSHMSPFCAAAALATRRHRRLLHERPVKPRWLRKAPTTSNPQLYIANNSGLVRVEDLPVRWMSQAGGRSRCAGRRRDPCR